MYRLIIFIFIFKLYFYELMYESYVDNAVCSRSVFLASNHYFPLYAFQVEFYNAHFFQFFIIINLYTLILPECLVKHALFQRCLSVCACVCVRVCVCVCVSVCLSSQTLEKLRIRK